MISLSRRDGRSKNLPWIVRQVTSTSDPPSGMNLSLLATAQETAFDEAIFHYSAGTSWGLRRGNLSLFGWHLLGTSWAADVFHRLPPRACSVYSTATSNEPEITVFSIPLRSKVPQALPFASSWSWIDPDSKLNTRSIALPSGFMRRSSAEAKNGFP